MYLYRNVTREEIAAMTRMSFQAAGALGASANGSRVTPTGGWVAVRPYYFPKWLAQPTALEAL
jgi:hypothetical protein